MAQGKRLKIGVQMDPIGDIDIVGDTSFALALEAQNRGHALFYYEPDRLSMRDGQVSAAIQSLKLADVKGAHFELGADGYGFARVGRHFNAPRSAFRYAVYFRHAFFRAPTARCFSGQ